MRKVKTLLMAYSRRINPKVRLNYFRAISRGFIYMQKGLGCRRQQECEQGAEAVLP